MSKYKYSHIEDDGTKSVIDYPDSRRESRRKDRKMNKIINEMLIAEAKKEINKYGYIDYEQRKLREANGRGNHTVSFISETKE